MKNSDSCSKSCSPSDWYKGGKCDLNGCYDNKSEHIQDLVNQAQEKIKQSEKK